MVKLLKSFDLNEFLKTPFATIFASILTTFIIAFVFFRLAGPVPISVTQTTVEKTSAFDVTAEGKMVAVPDTGEINLGVQVTKPTVQDAQREANQKIGKITEELKKLGVKESLIKTTQYNIYPEYDYQAGRKITGYNVNINLRVRTKELEKINQVIDTATSFGVSQVGGLTFVIDDARLEELEMEARRQAIEAAKKKAKEIAKAGDLKLGKIVNISENIISPFPPLYRAVGVGGGEEGTQVSPGETEITVSVTLSYETL